jgi:hypothetical protein
MSEQDLRLVIGVETASRDPYQALQIAHGLRQELSKSGLVRRAPDESGSITAEERDPLIIGALVIAVAPTVVAKVFEIIQAYVPKGVTVKVKIQTDKKTVEVEIPYTSSPSEVTSWVNAVWLGLPDDT